MDKVSFFIAYTLVITNLGVVYVKCLVILIDTLKTEIAFGQDPSMT